LNILIYRVANWLLLTIKLPQPGNFSTKIRNILKPLYLFRLLKSLQSKRLYGANLILSIEVTVTDMGRINPTN